MTLRLLSIDYISWVSWNIGIRGIYISTELSMCLQI